MVVACTSDLHVGSTLGLCPAEGVILDDGGRYEPSKAQLWVWGCWGLYWSEVAEIRKRLKAELYCVYNGDAFDGDHHNTSQIITRHPEPAAYIADRVFSVPRSLEPDRQFVVRGTETHVGPSGSSEEAFARSLRAERDPTNDRWSHWRLKLDVHGVRFDFQHHGRVGTRPWTRNSAIVALAAEIFYEHAANGYPHPHIAVRSHRHIYGDSYDAHPTRVIQTPAWQIKTAFAHKVAAESLADIGGIIVVVQPNGQYEVVKKLYKPELPPTWKAA